MDKDIALEYARRKKRKKRAAIISGICSLGIAMFIIIAFCVIQVDRFTITTSTSELSLTVDENHEVMKTTLAAPPLLRATDTQYSDIPENIEEGLGSKNRNDNQIAYFAYSFLLRAVSDKPSINYGMTMTLERKSNELEKAMKVMVIRNGIKTVYAQANEDGSQKPIYKGERGAEEPDEIVGYTIPFKDNKHIIYEPQSIVSGEYDKYTVVMWIDGWESDNSMKSGDFQAELKFSTESYNY